MRQGIAFLLIAALLFSGCATTTPNAAASAKPGNVKDWLSMQSRAKKKAIVGALVGAVLGAATATITGASGDEVLRRALEGGVIGAVAGFAIGRRQDQIFAHRDDAIRRSGYQPSQGYVAAVEEVAFNPSQPKPGQTATLYVRYLVLGPNPNEPIKVTMFRGLKYGDNYIFGAGPNEFVVPNGGGVVESTMQVTLPKKAPEGTYSVEVLIEDPQGRFDQAVGSGALYIVARVETRRLVRPVV
jgi:hypothetical protein